jgi:hypothetical protein
LARAFATFHALKLYVYQRLIDSRQRMLPIEYRSTNGAGSQLYIRWQQPCRRIGCGGGSGGSSSSSSSSNNNSSNLDGLWLESAAAATVAACEG